MLSHMYSTAPSSVHWFMVGDDDTTWFPHVLHPLLASLDLDPTRDSAYLGDTSESNRQSNIFGHTMAFGGGGMAISRALAARVYAKLDWCLSELDDFYGDGLMRSCIERVTQTDGLGPAVHLTRVPVFNQVDLLEWGHKGREYFSARFSRAAPVTLHHTDHAPPLISGIANRAVGTYKMWHLTRRMPIELMFRRFMVHLPKLPVVNMIMGHDAVGRAANEATSATQKQQQQHEAMQTVVITYGFHVRVYQGLQRPLDVDHNVDFDSDIPTTPDFVGIDWLLERETLGGAAVEQHPDDESKWPKRNLEYADYWLAEVDEVRGRMVYVDERSGKRLAVQVLCPKSDSGGDENDVVVESAVSVSGMYSLCST
ncbi:hypothetical protein BCR44DRAFT_275129 [Catenaria anguillulae PL171]|uniref:Uncharacterized protein n=1 Tax=Catenaria anguillulae PL171 TaxID=765915 RepID=A0A1Y2HEM2_9FUNG|nr:hypothetical protein BCR44DRAFT_275129 [Catenaria anguillulae PL171]